MFAVLNLIVFNTDKLSYRSSTKCLRSLFTLITYSAKFDLSQKELIFGGIMNWRYLFWIISLIQLNHKSVHLHPPDNLNMTGVTMSPDADHFNPTATAANTEASTDSPVTYSATFKKTSAAHRKP